MGYIAQGFDLDTQFRSFDANTTALTAWRGAQTITFSDDVPATGVAPFLYSPRVIARGWGVDAPAEKLRIKHTFGDPDSTIRADNRATGIWGTDADTGYGDCPAHTYAPTAADFDAATADGTPPATELTYTHTVELERADGETETVTRTITVLNPDHVFRLSTVLVDPDGDFSGAPTDPYGKGTYGTATALPATLIGGTRYLIRRGKSLSTLKSVVMTSNSTSLMLAGFGTGANPKIVPTSAEFAVDFKAQDLGADAVLDGIDIEGQWVPNSSEIDDNVAGGVYITAAGRITMHNCNITKCSVGIRNTGQDNFVGFSNSRNTDFQNYGCLFSSANIYVSVGSFVERFPDSFGGGAGSLGNRGGGPDHGPYRFSAPTPYGRIVFIRGTAYSCSGWSMSSRDASNLLGEGRQPSHQSCSRTNVSGVANITYRASECIFEGGNAALNFSANKNRVRVIDALVDACVFMGSGNNGGFLMNISHLGVVFTNCLFVKPKVLAFEKGDGRGSKEMIALGDSGADYDRIRDFGYVRGYNNTFVDWSSMDTLLFKKRDSVGPIGSEVFANNLYHAPNQPGAPKDLLPLMSVMAHVLVPLYKGLKWRDHYNVADTDQATLDIRSAVDDYHDQGGTQTPNAALPIPASAIPIEQRRGVPVPFYDFLRNRRPTDGTASKGAVEPGLL